MVDWRYHKLYATEIVEQTLVFIARGSSSKHNLW